MGSKQPRRDLHARSAPLFAFLCAAVLLGAAGGASSPSTKPEHIRGTVARMDGGILTVTTSAGPVGIRLAPSTRVATLARSDRAQIKDGSFLGITSVAQPDGSQRAVEVHVFPDSMRGTGEGSSAWDWPGVQGGSKMTNGTAVASKMTNGTVSRSKMTNGTVTAQPGGSSLTLQYKNGASGGSQTITVPPGIPVVAIEPGQSGDLVGGAHVFVIATRDSGGELTAVRVLAGKDGVVPPM